MRTSIPSLGDMSRVRCATRRTRLSATRRSRRVKAGAAPDAASNGMRVASRRSPPTPHGCSPACPKFLLVRRRLASGTCGSSAGTRSGPRTDLPALRRTSGRSHLGCWRNSGGVRGGLQRSSYRCDPSTRARAEGICRDPQLVIRQSIRVQAGRVRGDDRQLSSVEPYADAERSVLCNRAQYDAGFPATVTVGDRPC